MPGHFTRLVDESENTPSPKRFKKNKEGRKNKNKTQKLTSLLPTPKLPKPPQLQNSQSISNEGKQCHSIFALCLRELI